MSNGGDEINVILPGHTHGWPKFSFGRTYEGPRIRNAARPIINRSCCDPLIALTGLYLYTGDKIPGVEGNSVGSCGVARFRALEDSSEWCERQARRAPRELLTECISAFATCVRDWMDGSRHHDEDDGALRLNWVLRVVASCGWVNTARATQ
jgi:hypothetical protein